MNISAWSIYWLIKLDAIISMMGILGFVSLLAVVVTIAGMIISAVCRSDVSADYYSGRNEEERKADVEKKKQNFTSYLTFWYNMFKRLIVLPLIFLILGHMIPTTKEMAAIYVIPKIANSEFVNETLPAEMAEIYSLAKDWMKSIVPTPPIRKQAATNEVEKAK